MKFNLTSKLYASFSRWASNAENESFNEVHEVAEPVFWVGFACVMLFAVVFSAVTRSLRLFRQT